ncbi:MAG TPA: M23 family metallopeptidase, partial [Gemmatirosa sp.]
RGTPVLAADDGRVWKVRWNALGGNTIYAVDPLERFVYYYAHLDRYRDGLAEGAAVQKGDTLGFVGTTGNAPPDVPHLHFQVARLGADRRYWAGTPVDALPFLRAADAARARRAASAAITSSR